MVNWNSIVSSFNAKGTLLKWLKQVDEQLEQGQLESVTVADETTTSFCLLFTFADGTTIKTDAITKLAGADGQDGTSIYWHYAIISNVSSVVWYGGTSPVFELEFVYPSLSNEAATDLADVVSKSIWQKHFMGQIKMVVTDDNIAHNYYAVAQTLLEQDGRMLSLFYGQPIGVPHGLDENPQIVGFNGQLKYDACTVYDYVAGVE